MTLFNTVVCPTDLAPECDAALAAAATLATGDGTRLVALHCRIGPRSAAPSAGPVAGSVVAANSEAARSGRGAWEELVATGERVAETVVREAASLGADLVVLRSRRRPIDPGLLGSTVEAVCRTAPCPVLVTRPDGRGWLASGAASHAPHHVLVAYDFWDDAELALRYALAIAERYGAEAHVLHVVASSVRRAVDADLQRQLPVVERRLAGAVPDSIRRKVRVSTHVRVESPYREILSFAEEHSVDLLCVGARGRDFGTRSLFGSNSDRVLRQAPCSILVARPLRPALALPDSGPEALAVPTGDAAS